MLDPNCPLDRLFDADCVLAMLGSHPKPLQGDFQPGDYVVYDWDSDDSDMRDIHFKGEVGVITAIYPTLMGWGASVKYLLPDRKHPSWISLDFNDLRHATEEEWMMAAIARLGDGE